MNYRFLRFTKEYDICAHDGHTTVDVVYGSAAHLKLSTGDVDVIFAVSLKKTDHNEYSSPTLGGRKRNINKGKKPWGSSNSARIGGDSNHLNFEQFVEALLLCAVKMYTSIIEKETGTIIDCLPQVQRQAATRSAFEVMLLKILIPKADAQGCKKIIIVIFANF